MGADAFDRFSAKHSGIAAIYQHPKYSTDNAPNQQ
jgi:hypothetical protein